MISDSKSQVSKRPVKIPVQDLGDTSFAVLVLPEGLFSHIHEPLRQALLATLLQIYLTPTK